MVKVKTSQIPEDSPIVKKVKKTSQKGRWRHIDPDDIDSEIDNYFASYNQEDDINDEKEKTYFRYMLSIPDFGIILNAYQILSIEKAFRLDESNYGGENITPAYGIIINQGIKSSPSNPKHDIELWFKTEELRDQRYDKMMKALDDAGIKIVNV